MNKDVSLHDARRLLSGSVDDHVTASPASTNPNPENIARDNNNDIDTRRKRDSEGNEKPMAQRNRVIAVVGDSDGDIVGVIEEENIWHHDKL